jgi:LAS superfamily LD-carboxypeptidase LdcB
MSRSILLLFLLALFGCSPSQTPSQSNVTEEQKPVDLPKDFTTEYIRGLFDPVTHEDFVKIDTLYADRPGLFLRKDTYAAFLNMHAAAKAKGINLVIRSATRNFDYQKGIWERKWKGETKIENGKDASVAYPSPNDRALAILRYSSMPGTSRHHWGTDLDLNSFDNDWFAEGEGLTLYDWMVENGASFGFCQPYTPKGDARPHGYEEEKWHWSYMPISSKLTKLAESALVNEMISGFDGSETAVSIDVVSKYVLGVNSACK